MLEIRETTLEDLKNVQRLWADGEVMRFVGFPEGLHEPEEALRAWIEELTRSASLDVKLFAAARGRGIATKALTHAIREAFRNGAETVWVDPAPENARAIALYRRLGFTQKDMPAHVIAQGEDPETNLYFELHRN